MTIVSLITDGSDHRQGNNNTEIFTLINRESIIAVLRLADEESGDVIDSWVVLIGDMY